MTFLSILQPLLIQFEGFSPTAIWDVKQWSWGYGSFAGANRYVKPAGTITKEQAWKEAQKIIQANYNTVKAAVKVPLNDNQWAALMSFTYNLGPAMGKKMASYINAGDEKVIKQKWNAYVVADGKRNSGLVKRRAAEYALYNKAGVSGIVVPLMVPVFFLLFLCYKIFS